ncbi:DUF6777 domain-containing protein [Yinghuangia soli]|uniref:DUF6777 domain-containing protein n=1 Tax=Yinghuangia soli TaxID=2908204 RepID=A0AA41Q1M7_9ACTN|nr:DUF6777 domain-containing protein [Yinghuangia soli]MCF2529909.1 hypothetical protein [Yinghuangia soli]
MVALAVVVALIVSGGGGGGKKEQAAGEVLLENAASTGPDPFTASVASPVPTISAAPPTFPPAPIPTEAGAAAPLRVANGGTVGLYGGTQDNTQCDPAQMTRYLGENPPKAAAWVDAVNVDTSLRWSGGNSVTTAQIPEYLAQLTPVLLRADTRVTNNGFSNSTFTSRQTILQTGSAVLVDTYGVPRARCACGNPLSPPKPAAGKVTYKGTQWPGFSPTTVVVVSQSVTVINQFTLVNIYTGTTYPQPPGYRPGTPTPTGTSETRTETVTVTPGQTVPPPPPRAATPTATPTTTLTVTPTAPTTQPPAPSTSATTQSVPPPDQLTVPPTIQLGTGDIQVTLLFTGDSDMDLHVVDPSGQEIYFRNRTSSSGGRLDRDEIPGCGAAPATHAENVFWPQGGSPSGAYSAFVVNYAACPDKPPATYQLTVKVGGRVVSETTGSLPQTRGAKSTPVNFTK